MTEGLRPQLPVRNRFLRKRGNLSAGSDVADKRSFPKDSVSDTLCLLVPHSENYLCLLRKSGQRRTLFTDCPLNFTGFMASWKELAREPAFVQHFPGPVPLFYVKHQGRRCIGNLSADTACQTASHIILRLHHPSRSGKDLRLMTPYPEQRGKCKPREYPVSEDFSLLFFRELFPQELTFLAGALVIP